jgi:hypothetical protein
MEEFVYQFFSESILESISEKTVLLDYEIQDFKGMPLNPT